MKILLALALALAAAVPALAQQPSAQGATRAEVLVLGTYHMANPGRDIHNMRADDVLAPKRQAEIAALVEVLKRFRPTKIAVERNVGDERTPGLRRLPGRRARADAQRDRADRPPPGQGAGPQGRVPRRRRRRLPLPAPRQLREGQRAVEGARRDQRRFGDMVKAQGEYLASHTILETLVYMNADEKVAQEIGLYHRMAHLGEPGDWAGADLLADWFRRNMRISPTWRGWRTLPSERVLVIYGSGHLGWLRQAVASDPTLRLRTLAEFVR